MELRIEAIHFNMSEQLKDFVEKKMGNLPRFNDAITDIDVTLRLLKPETNMNKEAEVRILLPQKKQLISAKTADSFEEAISCVVDSLKPMLERAKNK